jgi:hypothetical protein
MHVVTCGIAKSINIAIAILLKLSIGIAIAILFWQSINIGIAILLFSIANNPVLYNLFTFIIRRKINSNTIDNDTIKNYR